ncbi:peptidylprolyl isomerase [Patescibacteria group bacterium]
MKKAVLIIFLSIFLSACTNKTPINLDEISKDNKSIVGMKTGEEQAQEDLSVDELSQTETTESSQEDGKEEKVINLTKEEIESMSEKVILKTSKGDIVLKLYSDKAPETVKNFLTKGKSEYYKDLNFHRVENWVIQGGDPKGNGTGGGKMPTELSDAPFKLGSLGVARGGDVRVSNDSQFFICTDDCAWLTGQYTNFGEVIEGMEIAKNIEIGDKILSIEADEKATDK